MKGMYKEAGKVSQGYGKEGTNEFTKGMNAMLDIDVDKIKTISKDQVVTYCLFRVDQYLISRIYFFLY